MRENVSYRCVLPLVGEYCYLPSIEVNDEAINPSLSHLSIYKFPFTMVIPPCWTR